MPRFVGAFAFFTDREEICREALIRAGFCDILQVLTEPVKIDLKKFFKKFFKIHPIFSPRCVSIG
jgi:hypothetical protein